MKSLKSLIVALTISATLFSAKPSQAAVGVFVSPAVVVAGLLMVVGGGAATPLILACGSPHNGCNRPVAAIGLIGLITAALGIVVLDGEQGITYSSLTSKEGNLIGLTAAELDGFNSEIDQVNILVAHVDAELQKLENPSAEQSAEIWSSIKDELLPQTFSALVKVSKQIAK